MPRVVLLIVIGLFFSELSLSQSINGTIKDKDGNPVPYSTVFVRELSLGAAANMEGHFSIKVAQGKYTCVFQSLGYQTVIKEIEVSKHDVPVEIVLSEMIYDLSAVEIAGKKEDPAYDIIRKVIARAPYNAEFVKSYRAEVYIKGSLHIKSISNIIKWLAKDDIKELDIKEGDTYLQESVNNIEFTAPDNYKQTVVSFHNTFPEGGGDMSSNAIGFISGNIYRPNGFGVAYSPINKGAFEHYRYKYEGKINYDTYSVHKILILPKGKGSQYVEGTIYIVDKLWCVSNLEIFKEEQLGVKLDLRQNYNEVKDGAWLPVSNQIKIDADILGNSGEFNYHTAIRYNELHTINEKSEEPVITKKIEQSDAQKERFHTRTKKKVEKKQEKLNLLESQNDLTTSKSYKIARLQQDIEELKIRDSLRFDHQYKERYKLVVDSNARVHDSTFWRRIRPIPLTRMEEESNRLYDSTLNKKSSDTTIAGKAKIGAFAGKLLLGGSFISDTVYNVRTRGLGNPFNLSFDVIDGLKYRTSFTFYKKFKNKREAALQPMIGYAFGSKRVLWEVLAYKKYEPSKRQAGIRVGQQTFDYNPDGIHPLESTIEALVFRENPARFYHASYLEFKYSTEITHGLSGNFNLYIAENKVINNSSDYSFFFRDDKRFKPNIPDNPDYSMQDHQDLSFEFSAQYKPMPFYYIRNGIKVPYYRFSDTPEFTLAYRKGVKIGMFDTDYDLIKLIVQQQKRLGLSNRLNYRIEAGYFLNTNSLWFAQYQHFAKRPLIAGVKEFFPYFLLIDSYRFSTKEHFAVAHLQYKSPFILLKRLPVFRNRLWNESIFFSYLYTPDNKNYTETGYGIGGLIFNLGVFAGFRGSVYQQTGIRLAFTIFGSKEVSL